MLLESFRSPSLDGFRVFSLPCLQGDKNRCIKRKGIKQSAGVGTEPRAISPEAGEENEVKSHHYVETQPQNFKAQRKSCWWSLQARLKSICARRGSSERLGGFPCLFLQLQLMGGGETGFPDHKPQLGDKSGPAVSPLLPPPGSISPPLLLQGMASL